MRKRSGRRWVVMGLGALLMVCMLGMGLVLGVQAFSPETIHRQETVAADGARAATVSVEMPAGMMEIGGGSGALLTADFQTSERLAAPRVAYTRQGGSGTLRVQQAERPAAGWRASNRWRLRLDRQLPLALVVRAGDGLHSLDLRELTLEEASIAVPAKGVMNVNLAGYWPEDVAVTIQGGGGLLVLTLPQGMGAQVTLDGFSGEVETDGIRAVDGEPGRYANARYGRTASALNVRISGQQGGVTLRTGGTGDLPVEEALKVARLIYSKQGTFACADRPDDGRYLSTDTVTDLWYDYLCERGPEHRVFDGDDPLTQELAAAEMIDRIRRDYYRTQEEIRGGTMKFNGEEFMSATLDMLLKARRGPAHAEFSLTHFMGSFSYSVERAGDRLYFTVENQTDLASGTHLPLRFPDGGYTESVEALVARDPQLADAFLLELVQSKRYPLISILEAKSRQETEEARAEGGGTMRQTFTWSEPYLAAFETLPPWPEYVSQLALR